MKVILSIDQSTQGTKSMLWSMDGRLVSRADCPHKQLVNEKGWISHDLNEIWDNVRTSVQMVLKQAKVLPGEVLAIGLSNQRETACCWDRATGKPLCPAVVWQCSRASSITDHLKKEGWQDAVRQKTGLLLSPYFSAPKLQWMLKHEDAVKEAALQERLCCGTVDSYLLYRMTEGRNFQTDYSNASRTLLMNLDTMCWDQQLLELFGLQRSWLPDITGSDACFGETVLEGIFPAPVAIHAVMGDSHAALFAHRCTEEYEAKVTYGTGSSIMMNAGSARPMEVSGISTSIAWGRNDEVVYCLEGNINDTGSVITWLVNNMKLLEKPSQAGKMAGMLSDNQGVYLVPAFSGLGTPYHDDRAAAAIIGMNRNTKDIHIVRAAEESIAYQIADVIWTMEQAMGRSFTRLCADGGPTKDSFLMQFEADILNRELEISKIEELSGAGAAFMAGISGGYTTEEALFQGRSHDIVRAKMCEEKRRKNLDGWHTAVNKVLTGR